MMNIRTGLLGKALALTLIMAGTNAAWAQPEKLAEGQSAPGLDIETWLHGSETTISPGKVYILEFWAPKVEACKRAIPILTSIQREFRDDGLVVIAVTGDLVITNAGGGDR